MNQKTFETADLYLASAISILINSNPDFIVQNGKVIFTFPINDDLYKAMSAYNGGVAVNSIEYAQTIKRLRAEMLMRRGMWVQK